MIQVITQSLFNLTRNLKLQGLGDQCEWQAWDSDLGLLDYCAGLWEAGPTVQDLVPFPLLQIRPVRVGCGNLKDGTAGTPVLEPAKAMPFPDLGFYRLIFPCEEVETSHWLLCCLCTMDSAMSKTQKRVCPPSFHRLGLVMSLCWVLWPPGSCASHEQDSQGYAPSQLPRAASEEGSALGGRQHSIRSYTWSTSL